MIKELKDIQEDFVLAYNALSNISNLLEQMNPNLKKEMLSKNIVIKLMEEAKAVKI